MLQTQRSTKSSLLTVVFDIQLINYGPQFSCSPNSCADLGQQLSMNNSFNDRWWWRRSLPIRQRNKLYLYLCENVHITEQLTLVDSGKMRSTIGRLLSCTWKISSFMGVVAIPHAYIGLIYNVSYNRLRWFSAQVNLRGDWTCVNSTRFKSLMQMLLPMRCRQCL